MATDARMIGHTDGNDSLTMDTFRHEALLYAGDDEFVERASSFIRDGVGAGEPVLVAIPGHKIDPLREQLGDTASAVMFADMRELGRNPGRIISAWHDFIAARTPPGGRVRGIGEPIWAARSAQELIESQRHEALSNVAFTGKPAWILCPYDVEALDPAVIDEAYRSHPFISQGGIDSDSSSYTGPGDVFDVPLPEPAVDVGSFHALAGKLGEARRQVAERARAFHLDEQRADDLVLCVNEEISNSVRHGDGEPRIRIWEQDDMLVVEIRDHGRIVEPLVGRRRPDEGQEGGFGLWLVNQLCDLVQIRTYADGTVVRLHMIRRR